MMSKDFSDQPDAPRSDDLGDEHVISDPARAADRGEPRGGHARLFATTDAVELLRTAYPSLVKTARAVVGENDAEDIVQQALIDVFQRFPDFEGLEFPTGYLRVCVIRRAWRHKAQLPKLDDSALPEALEAEERVGGDIDDVIPLLQRLAPKQRTCVFLNVFYGFSDREIATVLGCRPVTVRTQITRGLRNLGLVAAPHPAPGSQT